MRASRAFSSSLRCCGSMLSGTTGLGVALSSSPFVAVTPGRKLAPAGMDKGDMSTGKKLLRFVVRGVGLVGERRVGDAVCGGLGTSRNGASLDDVSIVTSGIGGGAVLSTSADGFLDKPGMWPPIGCRSDPVVEMRTSICGVADERDPSTGTTETDFDGGRCIRPWVVEGRDDEGESDLILPMDIFFRKPHLFDFESSLWRGAGGGMGEGAGSGVYELSRSRRES